VNQQFSHVNKQPEDELLNSFDPEKFLGIVKKSWPWITAFFVLSISLAYLYVRYTKPLFESSSIIKLNFESEANTLGLASNLESIKLNELSGEIEILKSKLFLSRVVDVVGFDVSYVYYGTYLTDERYNNNPFVVSYKVKDGKYYDRPFDLEIIDENRFSLGYEEGGVAAKEEFKFGEPINTSGFNFLIEKTGHFTEDASGPYFFTINSKSALISYLENSLDIRPENFNAKTIRISITDFNKFKAHDLVTAIDTIYLGYTKEAKNQVLEQKINFLKGQISSTENNLEGFDNYFESFTIENRTTDLNGDMSRAIKQLNRLDSQRYNLKERIVDLDLVEQQLKSDDQRHINTYITQNLPFIVSSTLEAFQILLNERAIKLKSYNESTFIIQQLDNELDVIRVNLKKIVEEYKADLKASISEVLSRRKTLESSFNALPSMGTEYNKNRRLYSLQENFLLSLRQSKMELEITRAGTVTNYVILAPASLPSTPIKPQKLLIMGIGGSLAFVMSIIFLLVKYLTNNRITSQRELERLTSVSVIGSVPFYKKENLEITKLVITPSSKSALSESLRSIRTNMEFLNHKSEGAQVITITSTISGEGKTFVAVNLGAVVAFSKQKVCIVDLDMRKPKVHLAFAQSAFTEGASTILIGKSKLEDCIHHSRIDNLDYIPAGPNPPNPSELILNPEYQKMIDELKSKYDLVILDTPPVGLVTDAILSMKKSDIQFYVVRANYSKRSFVKSIDKLRGMNQFNQLSVIFNGVNSSAGYGYGYGYGYYEESSKS